jgi:Tol biopolymer transport system component
MCAAAVVPPGKHPKTPPPASCPKPRVDTIYVVGADGLGPRRFAAGVEPSWSADGTELAYSTGRFLAIQGVDGNPPRDLIVALPNALAATGAIGGSSWSPDGRRIVFSVSQTNSTLTGAEWREELYTVDVAQVDVRQLTATVAGESDHSPSYSPDGTEIAYAHWGSQPGIWLVNPDGTNAHPIAPVDGYPAGVTWSPDGRSLAFALFARPFGGSKESGIYVIGADGGDLHRVATTNDRYIVDRPTWSPDGGEIEFTADDTSTYTRNLYAVRPDGADMRFVLREPWDVYQPAWQP